MRTVHLAKLLQSMQPNSSLLGICFTPRQLDVAVTSSKLLQPKKLSDAAELNADAVLKLVRQQQV